MSTPVVVTRQLRLDRPPAVPGRTVSGGQVTEVRVAPGYHEGVVARSRLISLWKGQGQRSSFRDQCSRQEHEDVLARGRPISLLERVKVKCQPTEANVAPRDH
ncbi:hypothetical protein ElyMa_001952800 [Elysia marginata]|uniref:Uncharacterized protein n=1 Tax=Elysia marginata TaxID=1093978 RepID=A0AAV4EXA0_9GAST|nr:hypothetical protein ElyMa_001952800 [Elysia marginata]